MMHQINTLPWVGYHRRNEIRDMWRDINGVQINLQNRKYFKLGIDSDGAPEYICIGGLHEGIEFMAVHLRADGTVYRLNQLPSENVEHPFVEPSITLTQEMYQGMQMIHPIDDKARELVSRVEKEYNTRMINLYFKSPEALKTFVEEFPWVVKT